jgi:gluconate:H+ symporter, GntP family
MMNRAAVSTSMTASLPSLAGILLITGAGGGFKQVLILDVFI